MSEDGRQPEAAILGEMDSGHSSKELAERACYSTPQFFRIAKRRLGEPPMSVRRRLLLERAAYRLTRTGQAVTEVALDAGFESLEGFGRAFKSGFGLMPSAYRKLKPDEYRIDLRERIHYAPPDKPHRHGETNMNVPELMTEHHCWEMLRFIDACEKLPNERLDKPMDTYDPFPWCKGQVTLREMMGRAAGFAAPWMDAINGEKTTYVPTTLKEMRDAIPLNRDGFLRILRAVEKYGCYDLTFVDAICDPPHVFSYVGVLSHALTHAAFRRMAISQELRTLDVGIDRVTDPIDFAGKSQKS